MNAYYFRRDKIAVSGAIKAQLPFSKGNIYQLLNSWNKNFFPEFSATASEQIKQC